MSSTVIPRGVTVVKWKHKTDKTTQIKYRVRIVRKDYKADKLFSDLDEAIEFLKLSKSKRGKDVIYNLSEKEEQERKRIADFIANPPLKIYIDKYVDDYVKTKPQITRQQIRNVAGTESFYKTIKNTEIEYRADFEKNLKGFLSIGYVSNKKKKFGDLKIPEITSLEINNYVRARLANGLKKSSVSREMTLLNKFFKKLRHIDNQFLNLVNPLDNYDRELLQNRTTKREFRLSESDEKTLFDALEVYPNPEMKQIILLSLLTAMRRSEIVLLEWSQIKENHIQLIHTKSGRPRKVYLTAEAKQLLNSIEKKEGQDRLFNYSVDGFNGSWMHLRTRLGLSHIRFHDFRRESISRFIQQLGGGNSILITEILGIANVKKFEENHLPDEEASISTEHGLLQSIGHADKETTKVYTNLIAK